MAHQLFYTSALHGLTDHSGFQFVALSEGTTAEHMRCAKRYLDYRPPYSAPSRPTPEDLERFPVAFGYSPSPVGGIFSLCRYLGSDYSRRPGNFLGIAVIAAAAEIAGAIPVEMWQAPWWPDTVPQAAPTDALLPLDRVDPGEVITPELAADFIRADPSELRGNLLAEMLDSVMNSLDGGTGVTVLVSDEPDRILSWLAALSYSLTTYEALGLSFISFSREPDRAAHFVQVIGTTPEAWISAGRPGRAFLVDERGGTAESRPVSAYARLMADHWRDNNLAQLDHLIEANAEMIGRPAEAESPGERTEDRDGVAGLLQVAYRRLLTVDEGQIRSVLRRRGGRLPLWLWSDLTRADDIPTRLALALCETARDVGLPGACARILANCVGRALEQPRRRSALRSVTGLDAQARELLAGVVAGHLRVVADLEDLISCIGIAEMYAVSLDSSTIEDAAEPTIRRSRSDLVAAVTAVTAHRGPVLNGIVRGLEQEDDHARQNRLTPELCELLAAQSWTAAQWSQAPRVGCYALAVRCQHRPGNREGATLKLAELASAHVISPGLLRSTLSRIWTRGPSIRECLNLLRNQGDRLPPREVVDLASSAWSASGVAGPDAQQLADRVLELRLDPAVDVVAADAMLVRLTTQIRHGIPHEVRRVAKQAVWCRRRATNTVADDFTSYLIRILIAMRRKSQLATAMEYADLIQEVAAMEQPANTVMAARDLLRLITPPKPPPNARNDPRIPNS